MRKILFGFILFAIVLGSTYPITAPADVWVDAALGNDTTGNGTQAFPYATIEKGISQISPHGTVHVMVGTYPVSSQIVIGKSLTIRGEGSGNPVVQAAAHFGSYMIRADSTVAATINISNLAFNGAGYNVYGVLRFYDCHTGIVENCSFRNITSGSYYGIGIVTSGTYLIQNNEFSTIGRIGTWVGYNTPAPGCILRYNTYTGKGDGDWLDYAVEVGVGGIARIEGNIITGCTGVASVDGSTSAGILVTTYYGTGTQAVIMRNTISGCTTGVAVGYDDQDTSDVVVHCNDIFDNDSGVDTTAPQVDARYNWWGSVLGPYHPTSNPSGTGNPVSDNVDFHPWGSLPNPCATRGSQSEIQPTFGTQMCPLAEYNIQAAETQLESIQALYQQVLGLDRDVSPALELIQEAEQLLEKARTYCLNSQNCIAGNILALEAQELLLQAHDLLESLLG
ncbi:MAG: right-handed parallel beta-helix repeat-containing protein [Theionarchaea archaeon]|nr:right-handed parallel beta-helix repeat-containing protein [Theionarchaea archaeon]